MILSWGGKGGRFRWSPGRRISRSYLLLRTSRNGEVCLLSAENFSGGSEPVALMCCSGAAEMEQSACYLLGISGSVPDQSLLSIAPEVLGKKEGVEKNSLPFFDF